MTASLYTGTIDWDRIYRTFHDPEAIANRVMEVLDYSRNPLVFSGFLETAGYLARKMPVTFVDSSAEISAQARQLTPEFQAVFQGDVTRELSNISALNVVIVCRISAYWHKAAYFEQLVVSLKAFPRERILIDFFDHDQIQTGQQITFQSGKEFGNWTVLNIKKPDGKLPLNYKVNLRVEYSFSNCEFRYEGKRSFFDKEDILHWGRQHFPDYHVAIVAPLIKNDPGFSLRLVHKNCR